MEWPPRSGKVQSFPEVDLAEWMDLDTARRRVVTAQATFFDRLVEALRQDD
jgi:predicted NUDIX family NTP pyrophosphohydrolase